VHHAVSGANVGGGHLGLAVDVHTIPALCHQQFLAFKRLDMLRSLEVFAEHSGPGHHVVLQHGIQQLDVFWLQQTVQCRLGELGEGLVGRGKHSERAFALQSSDELAGCDGSHKGRQVFVARSEFDDALAGWIRNLGGNQHRVDDVHHAVSGANVGGGHLGLAVDVHTIPALCHQQFLAFKRLDMLRSLEVFAEHSGPGHHVVLQHGIQQLDVFWLQQTVQCRLGELGEGLVGRGKHSERAFALQSSDELAGCESGHER